MERQHNVYFVYILIRLTGITSFKNEGQKDKEIKFH
jgi:hypothetical protein